MATNSRLWRQGDPPAEVHHEAVRVDNLMYDGCEPHWQCVHCGEAIPFHCWPKAMFEQQPCNRKEKANGEGETV